VALWDPLKKAEHACHQSPAAQGKISAGGITDHISAHYDLPLTLTEIYGVETPEETDGISKLFKMNGSSASQKKREFLLWDFTGYGGQIAAT